MPRFLCFLLLSLLSLLPLCAQTDTVALSKSSVVTPESSIQSPESYAFVERDSTLYLDVYQPSAPNGYTIVHIFGGGFVSGSRLHPWDADYCRKLAAEGYVAVAMDYRLGLKGVTKVGITNLKPLEEAFYMAAADCSAAIAFLVGHAQELEIDKDKIILEGSSAGAITALMTDYGRCNGLSFCQELPEGWAPAGVVAYSGAIYSESGKVKWTEHQPAPTLLFHGTIDKIVPYKQLELFNKGFYGADALIKRFNKFKLPACIYRFTGLGHEVSVGGKETIDELNMFVKQYLTDKRSLHLDITVSDDNKQPSEFSYMTLKDLYSPKK